MVGVKVGRLVYRELLRTSLKDQKGRDKGCETPTRSEGRDPRGQDDCSELLTLQQLF